MFKRSSKITMLMLIVVFCAFAFVGCGTTKDNTGTTTTDQTTDTTKNDTTTNNDENLSLTITSPKEGDTIEGGTVTVVGNAKGDVDGIDKVKIQILSSDGTVLGEDSSLIADLDQQYSADVKYEITDDTTKNDDGTIDGKIRAYVEDTNGTMTTEKSISVKLK